jgi:hypothetical protein
MVAFTWDGEKQDNLDIYVKMVGSPTGLRLTTDSSDDGFPSWSPDGPPDRVLEEAGGHIGVYLISPLGGPDSSRPSEESGINTPRCRPTGASWRTYPARVVRRVLHVISSFLHWRISRLKALDQSLPIWGTSTA